VSLPIGLRWGARARLDTSLVANPLAAYDPVIHDGDGAGRNARPDPVALLRTSMENCSESLTSQFFAKDKANRSGNTIWIVAALGLILSIWVVAGLGLMTSIEAISSILISPSFGGIATAPLYAGLLAILSAGFVGILFTVHRARQAAWHEPVRDFAGFAWEVQD